MSVEALEQVLEAEAGGHSGTDNGLEALGRLIGTMGNCDPIMRCRMTALGQKETPSELVSDVRFGAVSGLRSCGF